MMPQNARQGPSIKKNIVCAPQKMARAAAITNLLTQELKIVKDVATVVAEYAHELQGLPVSQKDIYVVDLVASKDDFLVLTINHSINSFYRGDAWESCESYSIASLAEDLVVGASVEGQVTVWRGGQVVLSWKMRHQRAALVPLSGTLFACYSALPEVDVFDASTGLLVLYFKASTIAIAPLTDKLIAVGLATGEITIRSLESAKCTRVLRRHKNAIIALTALHGGKLVSAATDGTMRVWDWTTGACLKTVSCYKSPVRALVALSDGRFVTGCTNGKVTLWTAECDKQTLVNLTKGPDSQIDLAVLGNTLAVAHRHIVTVYA